MITISNSNFNLHPHKMNDYQRIEKAISYITSNFQNQPSLQEVAAEVYLSPYHFQRIFKNWAGISPKKFLQYLTLEHAKKLLKKENNVYFTSHDSGLSGTSRLHDLFVTIEAMTPGEYKNRGKNLFIKCLSYDTIFGKTVIGSTDIGICYIQFSDNEPVHEIIKEFPNANIAAQTDQKHHDVLQYLNGVHNEHSLKLHVMGTSFQIKVWQALLLIPFGEIVNYGHISEMIDQPNAQRAVGTAIGRNPVAYIIPCHRVIKSTGHIGEYRWGGDRKRCIVSWESAQAEMQISH